MSTKSEIAWAAGLYDAEGSASAYLPPQRLTRRRQMQVSQAGPAGTLPPVLVRFRAAVGDEGNITGPYRGYLFYWKTTQNDVIDEISQTLWPYLGNAKRSQLTLAASAVARSVPVTAPNRSIELERAWAAGFFDGEGSLSLSRRRDSPEWRGVSLFLPQSSAADVPDTLVRFHEAVGRKGTVTGPHAPRSPWSRLPQYYWKGSGRHTASAVLRALWPWLSEVWKQRAWAVRMHLDADFGELHLRSG